jgi:DNA primase
MDAPQEIKSRLDVADIIGEYLQLKPAGSGSFKACCPFHQEKTPSFYVNRPRQSWHCFGCDQGGDLISFVQRMEGLDFPDTLSLLAQRAGITLPEFNVAASSERKRLYEVNDLASRFFRSQLLSSPKAEAARAYVVKRGLDDLTADVWRIGYAPDAWSDLTDALKARGVTDAELIATGLVQKRDSGGVYDRFRDRLMFSIYDVHGHIVGFTGRILPSATPDQAAAKYVNTPETILYKKSSVLYGLDKAKGEIRRQNMAVIVEGNMDVVSSHQFGITNVVASSGTALTTEQLALLKRFTTNLAIAFDADDIKILDVEAD